MDFNEFTAFKMKVLEQNEKLINLSNTNLYASYPSSIVYDGTGHIDNIVYRCHLVEDWLRYYQLPSDLKQYIGVSNGVRHSIATITETFKDKRFLIPADVYPFYQTTLINKNIQYQEYQTLTTGSLFTDIGDIDSDIMLLTDPLKPLGREIQESEYLLIENWLSKDKARLLLVDCAYLLDATVNPYLFQLYLKSQQVIFMYSLSKSWCLPNYFGITIFPQNPLGKGIRESFKLLEKNQDKLNVAFMALNKYTHYPIFLKEVFHKNINFVNSILPNQLPNSLNNPSYLFYSEQSFETYLFQGYLVIPASVFGGKEGSVISTLL